MFWIKRSLQSFTKCTIFPWRVFLESKCITLFLLLLEWILEGKAFRIPYNKPMKSRHIHVFIFWNPCKVAISPLPANLPLILCTSTPAVNLNCSSSLRGKAWTNFARGGRNSSRWARERATPIIARTLFSRTGPGLAGMTPPKTPLATEI